MAGHVADQEHAAVEGDAEAAATEPIDEGARLCNGKRPHLLVRPEGGGHFGITGNFCGS